MIYKEKNLYYVTEYRNITSLKKEVRIVYEI